MRRDKVILNLGEAPALRSDRGEGRLRMTWSVFLAHEAVTQFRSARFRGVAVVYVLASAAPAIVAWFIAGRSAYAIGPSSFNSFVLTVQPLLTVLLAVVLSVDAIVRERDEGSFSVLSVVPMSSAGYVFRRWLALLTLCVPLTLIPTLISAALAAQSQHRIPRLAAFSGAWLLYVLPPLVIFSAMAMALGTITGRTVLAVIFGFMGMAIGLDTANTILAHAHLKFDGPGELIGEGLFTIQRLIWAMRGYTSPRLPTDAGFPLLREARMLFPRAALTGAIAAVLLAASAFYLRRTRRDLRPWHIREENPVARLLRIINRFREDFTPDAGADRYDRGTLIIATALAAAVIALLVNRQNTFAARAAERYAAETTTAIPMSIFVVPDSIRIDGYVAAGGAVRTRATLALRNRGARPESHLSFTLNPGLAVLRVAASRGRARPLRVWERLDVDLDPPLAAGEARTLDFDLRGTPAEIDFNLNPPGPFASRWTRYLRAKDSIELTDLAQSSVDPAATEVRMALRASDLAPVPRYTPWTMLRDREHDGFLPEAIAPPSAIDVRLRHPYAVAADACGALAARVPLTSHCTMGFASYVAFGGPFVDAVIAPSALLAYIPEHAHLARTHGPSLAASLPLAAQSWPNLALPPRVIFVERPNESGERAWYDEYSPLYSMKFIGSSGAILFVPESIFTRLKPVDSGVFAAAIITNVLRSQRRVVPQQTAFFDTFYGLVAVGRVGGRRTNAVEPGNGLPPDTAPLLDPGGGYYWRQGRFSKVLAAIEYRVGADRFVEGINDFVMGGPEAGTAKELIDAIGRRGNADLSRVYTDYFEGSALPKLTLADVAFRRNGAKWVVTGAVVNDGSGEAFVPLALRTSQGTLWKTLRVHTERVPFAFASDSEPRSLQLDPDKVCYRQAAIGTVDTIDYRGGS